MSMNEGDPRTEQRWLLLIHQLPTKPAYFRVKIWRRLQGIGAVAAKNTVYALPANPETQEDFEYLKEIVEGGGEARVIEAPLSRPSLRRRRAGRRPDAGQARAQAWRCRTEAAAAARSCPGAATG